MHTQTKWLQHIHKNKYTHIEFHSQTDYCTHRHTQTNQRSQWTHTPKRALKGTHSTVGCDRSAVASDRSSFRSPHTGWITDLQLPRALRHTSQGGTQVGKLAKLEANTRERFKVTPTTHLFRLPGVGWGIFLGVKHWNPEGTYSLVIIKNSYTLILADS